MNAEFEEEGLIGAEDLQFDLLAVGQGVTVREIARPWRGPMGVFLAGLLNVRRIADCRGAQPPTTTGI